MATRTKTTTDNGDILKNLFGGSTKEMPVDLNDLRSYTKLSIMEAVSLFVDMEESGLIETSGRGENMVGWIKEGKPTAVVVTETPKPRRKRRTAAEMEEARKAEHAKVAYAAARDFELDALSNGAAPETAAKARVSVEEELNKETPAETVNEPEKDVRASVMDVREALETFYAEASREHMDATNERDGYVVPDEVKTLPPLPYGVNENTWDMAYNAFGVSHRDTLSARLFWIKRALAQHTEALAKAFADAVDAS